MRTIERNIEIPHEGAFCDIMWSDPDEVDTWSVSTRGAGYNDFKQGGYSEQKQSEISII